MKNCLIIGANSDIAKALAAQFAKAKYNLCLTGRNMEELKKTASDLNIRFGVQAEALFFDVLQYETHETFFQQLEPKPDVVIAAAGLLGDQSIAETDPQYARLIIDTNFTGVAGILNEAGNYFETIGKGSVIGISSVAGERGRKKNYFYGAAKAGFTAFLSGLRQRLHPKGVFVMTVLPGFVRTKMIENEETPWLLTAEPEKVAKQIFNGWKSRKPVIHTPHYWWLIMCMMKMIPEKIFRKLNV
ncbi:MAG: SDR family oxidoreductase [Ignavibacteriales bacterium]|jgi:Short-chain dehydrogenases of various substrate specificities|nr:MAG: SDR family oxidoreductase [Ignavibacteriaceae bacterium]MBW7873904.1 SDR family oxidoreductase [Ignavibacteria bacterium]MCZ2143337.1 SDR family oxidoreductase [Ignavibacteriales bacterium]OQY77602.1 MAG: short-chain dehydrogenase [Ignavibacteriales bacterium UTCHB3]MBV6444218.1 putative oxidoreductase [Ignavibacteriaceae bacterium]